jgi:glutamate 5-kinase
MVRENSELEKQRRLHTSQRLVVKLGTSIVTGVDGEVCVERVASLVRAIVALKKEGRQVVLVSSGAVGLGAGRLGLHPSRLKDLVMRQACAAVGQSQLMHTYEKLFGVFDVKIAQVLLTEGDFTDLKRYTNLRRTMEKLLKLGVLPIVNENDTVSTAELEYDQSSTAPGRERAFGDNDRLAALVMSKLEADALVLLTNVDGLLTQKPTSGHDSVNDQVAIPLVEEITDEVRAMAAGPTGGGRGGMLTKLEAVQIAMQAGGIAVIANGTRPEILSRIFAGERIGTTFISTSRMAGKRRWITFAAGVRGRVMVNEGARVAIMGGKASLLASGVMRVEQQFAPQDVVSIVDSDGREFARGIVNCASEEAFAMIRRGDVNSAEPQTSDRARVLVTRDNLVLMEQR